MAITTGVIVSLDKTEELKKQIKELTDQQVLVGIPASTTNRSDPITNAALGYIHEFGSPAQNIPARPFLYPTINKLKDKLTVMLKNAAQLKFDHKDGEAQNQLNAIGLTAANAVKATIVGGGDPKWPPLAPETIAAKGSSSSLIDTGQLLNSITYVIRKKG